MLNTLTAASTASVAVQPSVIEEAKDDTPLGYVLYVRPDAIAQIWGIEKVIDDGGDGTFTFEIIWLHNGKLAPEHNTGVLVNEKSVTHDGKPMIVKYSDTLEGLGFDTEDTQMLLNQGITLPGYKPERKKCNVRARRAVHKK